LIAADERVMAYVAAAPDSRRAALEALRALCRACLDGFVEDSRYGMPCCVRGGAAEVAFASQQRYLSLYVMRTAVLDAHRERLAGFSPGNGCVRYRRPDRIDMEPVRSMLAMTARLRGPVC